MVVRQRPIESITTEGASPSSTTRFTAVVLRCSSVLWSSNRPSIFIGLNISNTYASVDYPSDAAVTPLMCLSTLDARSGQDVRAPLLGSRGQRRCYNASLNV